MTPRFVDEYPPGKDRARQSPPQTSKKNLRVLLTGFFNRLVLVTRRVRNVQREVRLRTREKRARLDVQSQSSSGFCATDRGHRISAHRFVETR